MAELALWYVLKWMVYYLLFGMSMHVLDRYFGVPFYRWYYNRGQKDPKDQMADTVELGLLYNRSFKRRRNWALVISAIQSGYTVYQSESFHAGAEIIVLVFEAAVFLVGFRLGNWAYSFIRRQEGITETVDRVGESLEKTSMKDIASRWLLAPLSRVRGLIRLPARRVASAPSPVEPPTVRSPVRTVQLPEEQAAVQPPAFEDVLKTFEDRRKS